MRRLGLVVLLAMIGFAIAGCAGSSGKQTSTPTASEKPQTRASPTHGSAPRSVRIVKVSRTQLHRLRLAGHGAAFLSPTRLAFLTSRSSNCRGVPATIAVATPDSLRVRLKETKPANDICLANLLIEPVVIAISPKQINVHHRLAVRLYYPRTKRPVVFTALPLS
jgi:hypothetical protein